jgi:thiol-disulfide isomerase/thioredoxin
LLNFAEVFPSGRTYRDFLGKYGTPDQQKRWAEVHARVALTEDHRQLLAGFTRAMPILCLAGAWCGDCASQCPIFERFCEASPLISVRYFDRDATPELAAELRVCGGARVPVLVFLSEDGYEVARFGDRTLNRYRQLAREQIGPSCPTGIVPPASGLLACVTQDWLDQFERVQLILRLSPRLRQLHGD